AFIDSHMRIWYVDVERRKPVQVGKERYWNPFGDDWEPVWSPDSQWLAYATRLTNYLGAIHLYSLASGKATQITDGMSDANNPVFDKDSKYLYFTASTDSGPSLQPDVGSFARPVTRNIYLVVLSRNEPSPFAPESDDDCPPPRLEDAEDRRRGKRRPVLRSLGERRQDAHAPRRRLVHPQPAAAAAAVGRTGRRWTAAAGVWRSARHEEHRSQNL